MYSHKKTFKVGYINQPKSAQNKGTYKGKYSLNYYEDYEDEVEADLLDDENDYYNQNHNLDPDQKGYIYKRPEPVNIEQEFADRLQDIRLREEERRKKIDAKNRRIQEIKTKLTDKKKDLLALLATEITRAENDAKVKPYPELIQKETKRVEAKLEVLFTVNPNKLGENMVTNATTVGNKIVDKFITRIEHLIKLKEDGDPLLIAEAKRASTRANFEQKIENERIFILQSGLDPAYAKLALKYSDSIQTAGLLETTVIAPLLATNHPNVIDLILANISSIDTQKDIVTSLTLQEPRLTEARLTWLIGLTKDNQTPFESLYRFVKYTESTRLYDQIVATSATASEAEKWVNWAQTFINKEVDADTLASLQQKLIAANIDQKTILESPSKIEAELSTLKQEKGVRMSVNDLFSIFVRLANEATANHLDAPKKIADNAKAAVSKKSVQVQQKILELLKYKAFKTDKTVFSTIAAQPDDFIDKVLIFASYNGPVANTGVDWRQPNYTVQRTYIYGAINVILTPGRLGYFKNRHFPKHFEFAGANTKNTFFGRNAEDIEIMNSIGTILNSNRNALAQQTIKYATYGNGDLEVGVERHNGTLFVTHYRGGTGKTITDKELEKIKSFLRNPR